MTVEYLSIETDRGMQPLQRFVACNKGNSCQVRHLDRDKINFKVAGRACTCSLLMF